MAQQGSVTIKVKTEDRSLKDLRRALTDLETAFESLSRVKPFEHVSKDAKNVADEFTGVSKSAEKVERDIDSIDDASIDNVAKTAGKAEGELTDTADAAKRADGSLDNIDGDGLEDVSKEADKAGDKIDKADNETKDFNISLRDIAKSAVVISAVSKLFDVLVGSLDDAIKRFDTLNSYPRTMKALGHETEVVDRSTRRLVEGIDGLPTKLDDVIQTSRRLGGMTGNLDEATETTLALNNAFLASGASSADAARGTEQYIQMLANGKPDMQSWRTLQETMNLALVQTAEAFGFTGVNAVNDFYVALRDGEITFSQFNSKLIELSEAQGGFAELALTNSEGIATSWTNIQTAVSRGMETVVRAADEVVEAITGKNIATHLNNFKYVIDSVFGGVARTIRGLEPVIKVAYNALMLLVDAFRVLEPAIKAVVVAIVAMKIVSTAATWWTALTTAIKVAQGALQTYTTVAGASNTAMMLSAGTTGLVTKATGALTGAQAGLAAVSATATGGVALLTKALAFLVSPIGLVVAGITAATAAFFYFRKESEETKQVTANINEVADATSALSDEIDRSANMYESSKEAAMGQTEATRALIEETEMLAEKEMKSAADKELLKQNIDLLNESVDGLNVAYDEEQNALSVSNEAMEGRLSLMEQEQVYNEARERQVEVTQQHAEATKQLEENERQLAEAQEHLDNLPWYQSSGDAKEGVQELTEENARLTEQIAFLGEEQLRIDTEVSESAEAMATAREAANNRTITSMEQLGERQASVVESMQSRYQDLEETTTSMFDRIEEKSHISIEEMNENLRHNQEVVANWSENLALLSEQGVDRGMLDQLARLGPEGAPYVQELVDATPEQLSELEENFTKGGEVAKDGLFDSLGIDESDMIAGIPELATRTEMDLRSAIEATELTNVVPDALMAAEPDMIQAGGYIADGATKGLQDGTPKVREASENMADELNKGFRGQLQIQSPSQVFVRHGKDIMQGLLNGINTGKTQVIKAVSQLAQQINQGMDQSINKLNSSSLTGLNRFAQTVDRTFQRAVNSVRTKTNSMDNISRRGFQNVYSNVQTSMNRIPPLVSRIMSTSTSRMQSATGGARSAGRNFGMGFYWGLNSTAGSIYSLASSIARNALNRINRALRIHSPSRASFESGDFLGQGLWLGMKAQVGNVEKWSDKLAESALIGMLKPSPLGMDSSQFAFATVAGTGGTTDKRTIHHDNGVTIHIENIENHSDSDIPKILEESAWIIGREGSRLEDD